MSRFLWFTVYCECVSIWHLYIRYRLSLSTPPRCHDRPESHQIMWALPI